MHLDHVLFPSIGSGSLSAEPTHFQNGGARNCLGSYVPERYAVCVLTMASLQLTLDIMVS